MLLRATVIPLLCVVTLAANASGLETVRRFAIVTGSNDGRDSRLPLRYAVSDAQSFASVMTRLGGVDDEDLVVLQQPSLLELEDALHELRTRIASSTSARSEVFLYFSGHANETGLLLGEETFSYRSLRNWMELAEADVRIAVLDACASGAVTRPKGGRRRKPFLVDASSDTRGHAFLTSNTADEVAQESDRIGASFFTHFLLSGLRGAADVSGDGKVTLSEAYQFAFHETLGRTAETQAGAQHPAYDIALSGTGDVVMTDLRQTPSELVLSEGVEGRLFIWDAANRLVVELDKRAGRRVLLGLEPGSYAIRSERDGGAFVAKKRLGDGARVFLVASDLSPTTREAAVPRGVAKRPAPFGGLAGRWKLGPSLSFWNAGVDDRTAIPIRSPGVLDSYGNFAAGMSLGHWVREDVALVFAMDVLIGEDRISGTELRSSQVLATTVGARKYFLGTKLPRTLRPFVSASVGPYVGLNTEIREGVVADTAVATAGGKFGGGVDFQFSRFFVLAAQAGYHVMADFSRPVGGRNHYNGFTLGLGVHWVFGQGTTPHR